MPLILTPSAWVARRPTMTLIASNCTARVQFAAMAPVTAIATEALLTTNDAVRNNPGVSFCAKLQRCLFAELFSKYVFPGAHERAAFTCNSHEDCGTDAGSSGIECDFISAYETHYKVCKCKAGYLLNPVDSTCGKNETGFKRSSVSTGYRLMRLVIGRCFPLCRENEECWHYTCVCKEGHYRDSAGNCGT